MAAQDPRPLIGEPLAIDLLNTRWMHEGVRQDLLESTDGLAVWLAAPTVATELRDHPVRADAATLNAVRQARAALTELVDTPETPTGRANLNAVLEHGSVRLTLTAEGPTQTVEIDSAAWYPAWAAAENYLRLLADRPERLRPCANPACILHFYDVSKNGTRRWCSMTGCGNRAKASRHYARHRQS
ncbi:CGNR zinc finger domain-containing protein [Nonomuraea sp. NPDC046570]|uniref:CGNR zinc finger domain-containing protein n=1 Tax=Nonomuraea sp. NPDC046570 TaxID=3155255 RepID=UPI0033C3CD8E